MVTIDEATRDELLREKALKRLKKQRDFRGHLDRDHALRRLHMAHQCRHLAAALYLAM